MKLLTGGKDISQLIEKITWSGDTSQVSRKINFTIAQNKKDTLKYVFCWQMIQVQEKQLWQAYY